MSNPCSAAVQRDRMVNTVLEFVSKRLAQNAPRFERPHVPVVAALQLFACSANSKFASRNSRRRSFGLQGDDATPASQRIEVLVECGLYYSGEPGFVKCFCCDVRLRNWPTGDAAEIDARHAAASPYCWFLKFSRGVNWVQTCNQGRVLEYPPVYTRTDYKRILGILYRELVFGPGRVSSRLGFTENQVLLCISRKFLSTGETISLRQLVKELQEDCERRLNAAPDPSDAGEFDLAGILKAVFEHETGLTVTTSPQVPTFEFLI